ncbi:hypothetical protein DRP53_05905 [candidate division WOR-3 bacterium]|uniref:TonB C-terminal domain-containing protein n=1 Tax=candidate division WOR-3 bacterium TaxID=2052148 RepID=A0A660SH64_UNCW3|nr:MAG: hypothetical protein DRP53_05905 [candidate division WOR-3 bacterium]
MRRLAVVAILLVLAALFCQKEKVVLSGERGGTLVIGTFLEPSNLSPLYPSVAGLNEVVDLLFLHLHRTDPRTGKMRPELAESWEFSEDLKAITYYLRKDVKWWDGKPVTAEDIVFTFNLMKDPKTGYPNLAKLRFIDRVEKLGDYRVRFYFKKVYADELTDSDLQPLPRHLLAKEKDLRNSPFNLKPVGNGPFKFKHWAVGNYLELVANEDFYLGRPPLDRIVFRFYRNPDTLLADLKQGIIDFATGLDPGMAKALKGTKGIKVSSRPGRSYLYIGWNLQNELLKSPEIRKALTMAIDRSSILNQIYLKEGEISTGPIPPSSWGFNKEIKPIPYDPEKAKEILAEAGWKDLDYDRILEKGSIRNEFRLTIIANRENPDRVRILNQIADDLKAVGIRVEKEIVDIGTFIRRIIARDFDGMIMGWTVGDKIDPTIYWHSDPKKGRYNFVGYKNRMVDSLIEAGLLSIDINDAIRIWNEFQKIVYEDQPYTFLVVPNEISAYQERIQGLDPEVGPDVPISYTYWLKKKDQRIVKLEEEAKPPEEVKPPPTKPAEKPKKREERPKPEEAPKPPETVTPEKLLEEAAKRETTATAAKPAPVETVVTKPFKPAVIIRPKIIKFVPAKYPPSLIDLGVEGTVVVKVLVGTDGRVKDTKIVQSFGNVLCEKEAVAAARKAVFKPATKDGVPYEVWMSIPYKFRPPE